MERLHAGHCRVGIDAGEIDLVGPGMKSVISVAMAGGRAGIAVSKHESVGPSSAGQGIDAGAAGEDVVALVADDDVVERVAGAVDGPGARSASGSPPRSAACS